MCLECIEHIPNDRKLVSDLASLPAPTGVLIISTPYKYHKAYYNVALSPSGDGGHVQWGHTHDELREMLEDKLTVVAVESFHGFVAQKLINVRLRSLAILPAGSCLATHLAFETAEHARQTTDDAPQIPVLVNRSGRS